MHNFFMNLKVVVTVATLLGVAVAHADTRIFNMTGGEYKAVATMPNRAKQSRSLGIADPGLTSEYFATAPGVKALTLDLLDATGAKVWHGQVKANGTYLIAPDAKGVKVVFSGFYSSNDTPRTVVVMNGTGEQLTLDLEGQNGLAATRGVVPPTSFDPKRAIKFDPRESTYVAKGKRRDGTPVVIEGHITPGTYVLLWKTPAGVYRADGTGSIR